MGWDADHGVGTSQSQSHPLVSVDDTRSEIRMALYPCDFSGHRYTGRQQTVYPAILEGGISTRSKLRLCPVHFKLYIDQLDVPMYDATQENAPAICMICSTSEVDAAVFVTYYEAGQERQDLWGSACHAHVPQVLALLKMPPRTSTDLP